MAWRKSPASLIAAFDAALPDDPRVERRKMFGYPAAFANGHLFCGLHQESLMIRLGDGQRAALAKLGGTPFEPMPGRRMREYVVVPEAIVTDGRALAAWLKKGLAHAASLPPKSAARPKRTAGARSPNERRRPQT